MSERGGGIRVVLAGGAVAGLLALFVMGSGDDPSTAEDESRSCTPEEMRVGENCVNDHPMCPAPKVCPTVDTTPQTVPSIVPEASSTTQVPVLATVAPSTTVVPVQQRPSSEQAPQTAPPETAPPETAPPETAAPETASATEAPTTAPRPQRTNQCGPDSYTVKSGESWSSIARKMNVSARELASVNGTTTNGALWPGDSLCLPKGSGNAPETVPPTTVAPQAPPTEVATTQAPQAPATPAPETTQPRRPPGSERTTTTIKPVWVQQTTVPAPATTKAPQAPPKQPQAPATTVPATQTTRVGSGTIRTTVPPV